jgi:hypothetical protein
MSIYSNEYFKAVLESFITNNIIFVVISLIFLQIIGYWINKFIPINIYQVATVMSIFAFINLPFTAYTMIMGGIVATIVSYLIYNLFQAFKITNRILVLNIVTLICVITAMVILNCISLTAVAYTIMSYVSIPKSKINYLFSYIVGTIIIVILCAILNIIFKKLNIPILNKLDNNLSQLDTNLADWKILDDLKKANKKILKT